MILIVGGAFQGKKEYALQTFGLTEEDITDGSSCTFEAVFQARVLLHFQDYIRHCLQKGQDISNLARELIRRNPGIIVVANELGSGVVPMDAFDRKYREMTGRICCELAKEATEVHRVVCGIGVVIKGG